VNPRFERSRSPSPVAECGTYDDDDRFWHSFSVRRRCIHVRYWGISNVARVVGTRRLESLGRGDEALRRLGEPEQLARDDTEHQQRRERRLDWIISRVEGECGVRAGRQAEAAIAKLSPGARRGIVAMLTGG
jgi:hypothetical protein